MGQKTALRHGQLGILGMFIFITVVDLLILFLFAPDVYIRFALIEICLFVANPLIVFYLHNNWPRKISIISIALILIVWFFSLPLFHELSHVIGVYMIGSKPVAYHLFPKFWQGDFTTAWVHFKTVNDWRNSIPLLFPYIKDIFLLIIGFLILKGKRVRNAFWAGFIYAFFCLGSLFDIANNYFLKLLGYGAENDFHLVSLGWGDAWSNIIGIAFASFAVCISVWALMAYKSSNRVRKIRLWDYGESKIVLTP